MTNEMETNCYVVPVDAHVQITLSGTVEVYASTKDEANAKVQAQIDADEFSEDLTFEDEFDDIVLKYSRLKCIEGEVEFVIQTDSVECTA